MNVFYKWWMFWAVDMVIDENTMWTRRKKNIDIYKRKYKTLMMRSSVWFVEYGHTAHWRFLHELYHMKVQAAGLTRRQWVWKYIRKFWFHEFEADDFANKNQNKRPKEIYNLIFNAQ